MRITRQFLKKCATSPLEEAEFIDLSENDIVAIEKLEECKQLQTLVLSNNQLDSIGNVYCCRQLWCINLSRNRVKSLNGLSRFPVLGVLNLGCNALDWKELKHLSHMTIMSLTLIGNNELDSDPHYRVHVIDMLPHLWMLDGRMISAQEKKSVSQFFVQSLSLMQPIRHKITESVFVPTSMKNLLVTGIFGEKTSNLMAKFPVNYTHNVEMDKRRLSYLAYTIHQELQLQWRYTNHTFLPPNLEALIKEREDEREQCNMLLLLLMAWLEYDLPISLMRATLETAKLNSIGCINCADIFGLPAHMILDYASLLLSAAAVDREDKQHEGGLYSELYRCLCVAMESVQAKLVSNGAKSFRCSSISPRKNSPEKQAFHRQCLCLLASEVIHLMCLVPMFFESVESSPGLIKMLSVATKVSNVADIIRSIGWKVQSRGGDNWDVYHHTASYLLEATSINVRGKRRIRNRQTVHHTTAQLLQYTQSKSPSKVPRSLSAGAVSKPLRQSRSTPRSASATYLSSYKEPELGDLVLISENHTARIAALPEPGVAVLQINSKNASPAPHTPTDSYFYTDTSGFAWDRQLGYWTKDSLAIDLSNSVLSPSPLPHDSSTITLPSSSSLDGSEYASKTDSSNYNPTLYGRPLSQLSYRSDDLQTIPSQEELEDSADEFEEPPTTMRVDVATSPHLEHHRYVLQQYSAHSLTPDIPPALEVKKSPVSSQTLAQPDLQESKESERNIFKTLPPKVHLATTWEATKSIPSASRANKVHSCQHMDTLRENAKIEPHMSPLRGNTSTRPFQESSGLVEQVRQQPALTYEAWTPVRPPNVNVRGTISSSARIMTKRQAKTPPAARSSRVFSASSSYRPESRGNSKSSTVVLQQRGSRVTATNTAHLQAYRIHAQSSVGRFHYRPLPVKGYGMANTRKLGDVRNLYIGGKSLC